MDGWMDGWMGGHVFVFISLSLYIKKGIPGLRDIKRLVFLGMKL